MFSEKKSVLKMTLRSWPLPQAQCLAVRIRPSPIRVPVHTFMLLVIPDHAKTVEFRWLHFLRSSPAMVMGRSTARRRRQCLHH